MKIFGIDQKFNEILRHEYVDIEKTLLKLEQLKESTKIENLEYELFRQALYANLTKEYETAITKGKESLERACIENNKFLIVNTNILLGFIYWNRKNYEMCFEYYLAVLKYENHPRILNNMGVIYHTFGDIEEAYKYYKMAQTEVKKDTNLRLKAIIYSNLAECECKFERFTQAHELLSNALKIILELNNHDGTAYIYNAFGLMEMKKKNYKVAIKYFEKGENHSKSEKIILYYLDLLRNHAKSLYELQDYEGAKSKIDEIEILRLSHDFGRRNEKDVELLANIYDIEGKHIEANRLYKEYIKIVKENNLYNKQIRIANLKNKVKLFEVMEKINTLEKISSTDALTGIHNRYSLTDYLKTISAPEYANPITTIVLIDVDYFKEYNDFYGHAAGDKCLVKIVNQLSKKLNSGDNQLFRYGGDEFLSIIPNLQGSEVSLLLESIKNDIENLEILNINSKNSDYMTCSFGATTTKKLNQINYKHIFNLADKALYDAKAQGKNKISVMEF